MPKPTLLVCQHLERISRGALERYQDIIRNFVRRRYGVYALYRKDRLYYVGLARNLRNRLRHHLRDRHGKSWDRFSVYLTVGDSHIRELESLVLRIVRPRGNKQRGKFGRAENLLPRFKRDVRRKHELELQELIGTSKLELNHADTVFPKGKAPVLVRYIDKGMKLRGEFKGRRLRAHVLKSGIIMFKHKRYNSPSKAARAACGFSRNGWGFWRYERGPHEWVRLKELKK